MNVLDVKRSIVICAAISAARIADQKNAKKPGNAISSNCFRKEILWRGKLVQDVLVAKFQRVAIAVTNYRTNFHALIVEEKVSWFVLVARGQVRFMSAKSRKF